MKRDKSALHLAATHGRTEVVKLLLEHGVNVNAKSSGSWTALHNACLAGSIDTVRILVECGADVSSILVDSITLLHLVAQAYQADLNEIAKFLFMQPSINTSPRDSFGSTPFLLVVQQRNQLLVNLFSPDGYKDLLSGDALAACHGFNASIVDFGGFNRGRQVQRKTIYEVLYKTSGGRPTFNVLFTG
ncbi:ankyrin [Acephala macrosclerotiorum]|nr:ankyrin [Acephala macrosclerotiorum]